MYRLISKLKCMAIATAELGSDTLQDPRNIDSVLPKSDN